MSNIYSLVVKNDVKIRIWDRRNRNDGKFYTFFSDDDIKLDAKFTWDLATSEVIEIDFELINLSNQKYELCEVGRKPSNNPLDYTNNARKCTNIEIGDFYLIYLNENVSDNPNLKMKVIIGKKEFLNLDKGCFMPILFKISDGCPDDPNCNLDNGTPKTKDGSIIISQ